ncbi:MAG TPA: hypothetical protein VHP14_14445, partial [Anaerolineales bacterium]|nr:hypothetical protein [Anaerolineales bacterium]
RSSLSSTIDDMIKWFDFDVMLTFDRAYRADKLQQQALNVPGVTQTDVWMQMPARMVRSDGSESGMMYMFAPHVGDTSLIRSPAIAEGRWLMPEDDNAVVVPSALLQDEPELRLGGGYRSEDLWQRTIVQDRRHIHGKFIRSDHLCELRLCCKSYQPGRRGRCITGSNPPA